MLWKRDPNRLFGFFILVLLYIYTYFFYSCVIRIGIGFGIVVVMCSIVDLPSTYTDKAKDNEYVFVGMSIWFSFVECCYVHSFDRFFVCFVLSYMYILQPSHQQSDAISLKWEIKSAKSHHEKAVDAMTAFFSLSLFLVFLFL